MLEQMKVLPSALLLALLAHASAWGQGIPFGENCGCPQIEVRDTIWVSDNSGLGTGSDVWSCEHIYVLTEQVFVNAGDTLVIEPGTVVLGMSGEGRVETDVAVGWGVGSVRDVMYDVYPGALVVLGMPIWWPTAWRNARFNFRSLAIPWMDLWAWM